MGDADADPVVKPNAKQTNVGGDFPHMFDISDGGARVLVFTDKEQDTPEVTVVTARTLVGVTGHADQVKSLGESRDGGTSSRVPTTMMDDDGTPAIEGTFKCGGDCTLSYTGSGDEVDLTGDDDRLHVFRKQGRRYGCGS